MYSDIVELREFYASALGRAVTRVLAHRFATMWPELTGRSLLTLGYGVPLMVAAPERLPRLVLAMPAAQGVCPWPEAAPNCSALVEDDALPFPDQSFERIILFHALENTPHPLPLLREAWRVLVAGGRLLCVVPSRRGLWARLDHTPFGTGQPFSSGQIKGLMREAGLAPERVQRALYLPPMRGRLPLRFADFFEKWGERLFYNFGGVLIAEATKQLYAPIPTRRIKARNILLPLPAFENPAKPVAGRKTADA